MSQQLWNALDGYFDQPKHSKQKNFAKTGSQKETVPVGGSVNQPNWEDLLGRK